MDKKQESDKQHMVDNEQSMTSEFHHHAVEDGAPSLGSAFHVVSHANDHKDGSMMEQSNSEVSESGQTDIISQDCANSRSDDEQDKQSSEKIFSAHTVDQQTKLCEDASENVSSVSQQLQTVDSVAQDESSLSEIPVNKTSVEGVCKDDADAVTREFSQQKIYLFEYQWPQDGGEWCLLQEQVSEYLKIKSFKRKYPDLYRRTCDKEEKDFLRDKGVVTETQSDLGLTALRSEEVYDLMMKDYNSKYKDYISHLQEKQKKVIREKHKEYSSQAKLDKSKIDAYSKKAARSAAEFNNSLMRDRKEERRAYFDLQTYTIHYPKNKFKTMPAQYTKVGAYPVALIPGQYQENYKK